MKMLPLTALPLMAPLVQAAPVPPPAMAEVQLRAANHARVQASVASDHGSLSSLVDKDFRFTGVDGAWLDKPGFAEASSYEDVQVRLFGEVGLVHAMLVYLAADGTVGKTRYTDVYHWSGAGWRLVSAQLSRVANPASAALVREAAPAHAPWEGQDPVGEDEPVLRALNAGYVQAFLDSDVAWYEAHLAPDYLVVFGDGSLHDKGSLLVAASHPVTNMRSFPVTSVAIRRFGDVALVHAENPYERTDGKAGVNRYTDIWHKRAGRWVCVAAHITIHKRPA